MNNAKTAVPQPKLTPPTATPAPAAPTRGLVLIEPIIELLSCHIFIRRGDVTNTNRLTPSKAVIVDGMIVIDEWDLILPFHDCLIRTKRS